MLPPKRQWQSVLLFSIHTRCVFRSCRCWWWLSRGGPRCSPHYSIIKRPLLCCFCPWNVIPCANLRQILLSICTPFENSINIAFSRADLQHRSEECLRTPEIRKGTQKSTKCKNVRKSNPMNICWAPSLCNDWHAASSRKHPSHLEFCNTAALQSPVLWVTQVTMVLIIIVTIN